MINDITDYLKDGETPLDVIKRERRSTDNLLRHLADGKGRIRELEREVRYLRHYGNKDCVAMAEEAMAKSELEQRDE
jgi:hypothetical protein